MKRKATKLSNDKNKDKTLNNKNKYKISNDKNKDEMSSDGGKNGDSEKCEQGEGKLDTSVRNTKEETKTLMRSYAGAVKGKYHKYGSVCVTVQVNEMIAMFKSHHTNNKRH